ncbi:hypothetical protein HPB48_000604 [Haemaphysalis longicornis]|uniref:Uncharacterized protein n=1 Tax=Haemaphysalis longicornis TaxID=44386 RepID=A0A9J6H3W2_HAELO|nr:hypothetical protein HPB48_000604 [Haemaphysalis longicornis]
MTKRSFHGSVLVAAIERCGARRGPMAASGVLSPHHGQTRRSLYSSLHPPKRRRNRARTGREAEMEQEAGREEKDAAPMSDPCSSISAASQGAHQERRVETGCQVRAKQAATTPDGGAWKMPLASSLQRGGYFVAPETCSREKVMAVNPVPYTLQNFLRNDVLYIPQNYVDSATGLQRRVSGLAVCNADLPALVSGSVVHIV